MLFLRTSDSTVFESIQQANPLARLNTRVKRDWIHGKLDHDIPVKPPIVLDKHLVPEAVQNRWAGISDYRTSGTIPRGHAIAQVFDEKERSLLILSEPGYGKTISLLSLAQDLIRRHERDNEQPVPVVLFLSTWSHSNLGIEDWIVQEINQKYRADPGCVASWIQGGKLVLMLDALDEVVAERRGECVKAINQMFSERVANQGSCALAVCCRYHEYMELDERFEFEGAVKLQPLTHDQVRDYLAMAGRELSGLQSALDEDETLRAASESPLMLGMMSIAYMLSRESDEAEAAKLSRHRLVELYLDRAFERAEHTHSEFEKTQVLDGLSWIADRLQAHHHTVFMLESLQPVWLRSRWERLANLGVLGLAFGTVLALVLWLVWTISAIVDRKHTNVLSCESHGYFLVFSPIFAFLMFAWEGWRNRMAVCGEGILGKHEWLNRNQRCVVFLRSIVFFVIWMSIWIVGWFVVGHVTIGHWLQHPVISGLSVAVLCAFSTRLPFDSYCGTTESLTWSWGRAGYGLGVGVLAGVGLWVGYHVMHSESWERNLLFYLPLAGLIGTVLGGLSNRTLETKTRPNEGVLLSLHNSIYGAVVLGGSACLGLVVILHGPDHGPAAVGGGWGRSAELIVASIGLGMATMGVGFLWFGGTDAMRHFSIRFVLWATGQLPWRFAAFCDHAARLALLQKVGGGYIFKNHVIREYFEKRKSSQVRTAND